MNDNTLKSLKQMYSPIVHPTKIHIESEVVLPDYCADVTRITKVELSPKITSKSHYPDDGGLSFDFDGNALFKILYLSEGTNKLYSTFFNESFSHNFKAQCDKNSDFENVFADITLIPENVTCRLSTPRKMLIRGDLNVIPDIKLNREIEYFDDKDGKTEMLNKKMTVCSMENNAEADYNVSEKINLPREFVAAEEILDCDIRYVCESLKMMENKAIFTATAFFTCFYNSADENVSFCQPIEISQIIDTPGTAVSSVGEIRFIPTSLKADIDVDNYGENRVIDVDFSYTASLLTFSNKETAIAVDVFSPSNEINSEYADITTRRFVRSIWEKVPVLGSLKLKNPEISLLENVKPMAVIKSARMENDTLVVDGKLMVKMIGSTPTGFEGIDENLDFSAQVKLEALPDQYCDLAVSVREVDCMVTNNSIDVRADVALIGAAYQQASSRYIKSLALGEKKKISPRPPIILYYPAKDETLWEISKKYSLPQRLIRDFNAMETDKIIDPILKIPTLAV